MNSTLLTNPEKMQQEEQHFRMNNKFSEKENWNLNSNEANSHH